MLDYWINFLLIIILEFGCVSGDLLFIFKQSVLVASVTKLSIDDTLLDLPCFRVFVPLGDQIVADHMVKVWTLFVNSHVQGLLQR